MQTRKRVRLSDKTKKLTLYAILTALLVVLGLVNIPMPTGLSIRVSTTVNAISLSNLKRLFIRDRFLLLLF